MFIEDWKDKINEKLNFLASEVQENSVFIELKERFQNLSYKNQKIISTSVVVLLILLLLLIPLSNFLTSCENDKDFLEKRDLLSNLMNTVEIDKILRGAPIFRSADSLTPKIKSSLGAFGLLSEQIGEIKAININSKIIPNKVKYEGINVKINKLNIRQIINIGNKLSNMDPNVILKDIEIIRNKEKANYADVTYLLVSMGIDNISSLPTKSERKSFRKKRR